jgi:hypothetical protein
VSVSHDVRMLCSTANSPQKKLPGLVPALNLISRPIFPIACTQCALGMYPVNNTSKLFKFDCRSPS